jgi:phosphate transport system permease protein
MRKLKNLIMTGLLALATLICLLPLLLLLYYVIKMGISSINLDFFLNNPKPMGEAGGGMLNSIIGTIIVLAMASLIGIPIGLVTGIYLAENKGTKLAEWVRLATEVLVGIPSIVIGILVYGWLVKSMKTFSAFSGSIALTIIMIPILARSTEEVLLMVPHTLKEAAYALGASRWKTQWMIVMKTAMGGIVSAILSSIGRIAGETAPLLFTAFGNQFFSTKLFRPISTLPIQIFTYARSPNIVQNRMAWAGSLLLVGMVLVLNMSAKWIGYVVLKRRNK